MITHSNLGYIAGSLSATGTLLLLFLPRRALADPVKKPNVLFDFTLLRAFPALRSLVIVAVVAWFSLATLEGTFGRLIERTLGFHQWQFGQVFAFEAFVGVIVQGLLLAWLAKRTSDAPRLRVAYVAQGAGLALMPFAPSLGALFLMSALYAAGAGIANGTINGLCSRLAPSDRQGELFGIMQGARSIGFAIGPTIGGAMFDRSPSSPYLLAGGTCIAAALLVRVPSG
jgi:DHA1 family multidrug resistance protein-like MFS transporter